MADALQIPGPEFAADAYRACLYGRASQLQQQSAACQILLLHASNAELLSALQDLLPMFAEWHAAHPDDIGHKEDAAIENAERAIAKATGSAS